MSSHYHSSNKKGMSSSSSSSSSSTSSGRSRSSSSSSSRSRSNSPDTRRRHRREREHSKLSTTTKNRYYDDDERSNSSNSRERYQVEKYQQQPKYKDDRYKDSIAYNSKTTTTSSVDYNSIRSDKSSESTTSGGGRSSIGSDKNATTKISGNYEKIPEAPAPPKISKSTILFGKPGTVTKPGIQMKLIPPKAKTETTKKITVASAFNNESDDEVEEEMPPECRMRMRNIGRDTPTSSGPNSFGKTKQGFVDTKKVFERSLREACAD